MPSSGARRLCPLCNGENTALCALPPIGPPLLALSSPVRLTPRSSLLAPLPLPHCPAQTVLSECHILQHPAASVEDTMCFSTRSQCINSSIGPGTGLWQGCPSAGCQLNTC
ncbi:hypothetical protein P154DRAFT_520684 [Amniculicola lignicola CBS 123094]|uniref:Uncharacterized protein n=1 Tax=Amniculicola lignicola CBS 123094 TaxID=1392246 RepID=A0A6A5WM54_9PLEO|nr:hypothetical protein P154DRAFT_520684 [Amniculicola lignicola CBS 123094]